MLPSVLFHSCSFFFLLSILGAEPDLSYLSEFRGPAQIKEKKGEEVYYLQQETKHAQMLMKVVGKWMVDLSNLSGTLKEPLYIPPLSAYTSIGSIGYPRPKISLNFPFFPQDNDPRTEILINYVIQHLEHPNSGFKNNKGESLLKNWHDLSKKESETRARFAKLIKGAAVNLTQRLEDDDDGEYDDPIGPTAYFCDSIWVAILGGGPVSYGGDTYEREVIKRGNSYEVIGYWHAPFLTGEVIARDMTIEGASRYITWHKNLLARFITDPAVRELRMLRADRVSLANKINAGLAKIALDGRIPGFCEGCSYPK